MLYSQKQKNYFQGPVYIDYSIFFFPRGELGLEIFCFFNLSSQVDEQRRDGLQESRCRDSALVSTAFFMDLFGGYAEFVALFFFNTVYSFFFTIF